MAHVLWHLRGSVLLPQSLDDAAALDGVAHLLARQFKAVTHRDATGIDFDNGPWRLVFTPNWLALVVYERGTFRIEHDGDDRRLRYVLRSFHAFLFCLLGATFLGTFASIDGPLFGAGMALVAFGWVYGGNMMLARLRIPRTIEKAVARQ